MSPPLSKPISSGRLLHHNNRYDNHGRDLFNYRTYRACRPSGLSHVVNSSPISSPSPDLLSEPISDDDSSIESDILEEQSALIRELDNFFSSYENDMSLPGLGLDEPDDLNNTNATGFAGAGSGAASQTQQFDLKPETEWRFELVLGRSITIKCLSGSSEFFATEMVVGRSYKFTSVKGAIFTWQGCAFEVTTDHGPLTSALSSEYVAEETPCHEYVNLHFSLEQMRMRAVATNTEGPRTLIVGPENSGKSSLAKTLVAYALRAGRGPIAVNLDPTEGVLSLPGTLSGAVFNSLIEIEEGWGNAPMSGPNGEVPVKLPLVYYYGSMNLEEKGGSIFKNQIRQLALAVAGRIVGDVDTKPSGIIVDTPGALVNARAAGTGYDILTHIVSEFQINTIVCLGSERLYSDMHRRFDGSPSSRPSNPAAGIQAPEKIEVIKMPKSGGVAERDAAFMQTLRQAQTKLYFYGDSTIGAGITLQPRQQQVDFDSLTVWRRIDSTGTAMSMATGGGASVDDEDSFLPGDADEGQTGPSNPAVPLPASQIFERLSAPIPALRNCVLAVMNCPPDPENGTEQETLRDSSVMGFLYVTDIDEGRRRISLLSPVAGRVLEKALIWGEGIDGVLGLI